MTTTTACCQQLSTAWRQRHCKISALHVKINNLGTVQVTQSAVRVQQVVAMTRIQKCQRLVTMTGTKTKGRVAAPVGALGCLVVCLRNSRHHRRFVQPTKAHYHYVAPVAMQVNRQYNCSEHSLAKALAIHTLGTHAATLCSADVATFAHQLLCMLTTVTGYGLIVVSICSGGGCARGGSQCCAGSEGHQAVCRGP